MRGRDKSQRMMNTNLFSTSGVTIQNSFGGVRNDSRRRAKFHQVVKAADNVNGTNVTKDCTGDRMGMDIDQSASEDDDVKIVSVNGVNVVEEDNDEVIKIRGNTTFEKEDGSGDNDDIEFVKLLEPEIELLELEPLSKKRKQGNDDTSFANIESVLQEFLYGFQTENSFENGKSTYCRTKSIPLYLLNPADYKDDPNKQQRIRRAILTRRHHQLKDAKLKQLTEENALLRECIPKMANKIKELGKCGCKRNKGVDLKLLEEEPPRIPPDRYIPILPKPAPVITPFGSGSGSNPVNFAAKNSPLAVEKEAKEPAKPLINIGPARLQQIKSSTLSNINIVRAAFPEAIKRKRPVSMTKQHSISRPLIVPVQKVILPGGASSFIIIDTGPSNPAVTQSFNPIMPNGTKVQAHSATTASQILFGSRQGSYPRLSTSTFVGTAPAPVSSVLKQTLKNVDSSKMRTEQLSVKNHSPSNYLQTPIIYSVSSPTPAPDSSKLQLQPNAMLTRDDVNRMWTAMDDEDEAEDESAIIAAIKNSCPGTRSATSNEFSSSREIEFSKYKDIVFEEGDV